MDTIPLPPRPSLEQYKKRAKDLVAAARSKDPNSVRAWAASWLEAIAKLSGVVITPFIQSSLDRAVSAIDERVRTKADAFTLADAQFLIADAHGFEHWAAFATHIEQPFTRDSAGREFEAAADAVVTGDLAVLESLVRTDPGLVRARSARVHRATLLHYVAANGVEDYRQRTPANAVAVARLLLEAGAEVDALANAYSGGAHDTTMNLLVSSTHPAGAGLQPALVDVLLDFGASINGLKDDETPLMTALDFGYRDAAETLARRGARIDNVVTAAALGREDLVRSFVADGATVKTGVPLVAPPWLRMPNKGKAHVEFAFVWACKFVRTPVAEFLLGAGVSLAAKDGYKMTALHWAAANGMVDFVRKLLAGGAPLEVENTWGGTVLDSTVHFALYQPVSGVDYARVIELLVAAGANVAVIDPLPTGNAEIDRVLNRQ